LAASKGLESVAEPKELLELEKHVYKGEFDSGVKDVTLGKQQFIIAYNRLGFSNLMMIGYIPKQLAFTSAEALYKRFIALGTSILLFAIGLTLIFVKRLTLTLRQMWHATQKVSEGDFSVRVSGGSGIPDEVTGLADSFNKMANKIDELIVQTAEKARMEKELETAHAVQSLFFPAKDLESKNIQIAGRHISASECAGDWWNYAIIGPYILFAIGDVRGHGVSAALVTAGVHTMFSLIVKELAKTPNQAPSLKNLIDQLNRSVIAAAGGSSGMTLIAALYDTRSGNLNLANAGHCSPYLYRNRPESKNINILDQMKALIPGATDALGTAEELRVKETTFQLEPGDVLLWYTDGLFDIRISDREQIKKRKLFSWLAAMQNSDGSNAKSISNGILKNTEDFFGKISNNRSDDITFAIMTVPEKADFTKNSSIQTKAA
jgi:sigma-B regulation protein RsbU (phosphoserine phosphatase)